MMILEKANKIKQLKILMPLLVFFLLNSSLVEAASRQFLRSLTTRGQSALIKRGFFGKNLASSVGGEIVSQQNPFALQKRQGFRMFGDLPKGDLTLELNKKVTLAEGLFRPKKMNAQFEKDFHAIVDPWLESSVEATEPAAQEGEEGAGSKDLKLGRVEFSIPLTLDQMRKWESKWRRYVRRTSGTQATLRSGPPKGIRFNCLLTLLCQKLKGKGLQVALRFRKYCHDGQVQEGFSDSGLLEVKFKIKPYGDFGKRTFKVSIPVGEKYLKKYFRCSRGGSGERYYIEKLQESALGLGGKPKCVETLGALLSLFKDYEVQMFPLGIMICTRQGLSGAGTQCTIDENIRFLPIKNETCPWGEKGVIALAPLLLSRDGFCYSELLGANQSIEVEDDNIPHPVETCFELKYEEGDEGMEDLISAILRKEIQVEKPCGKRAALKQLVRDAASPKASKGKEKLSKKKKTKKVSLSKLDPKEIVDNLNF